MHRFEHGHGTDKQTERQTDRWVAALLNESPRPIHTAGHTRNRPKSARNRAIVESDFLTDLVLPSGESLCIASTALDIATRMLPAFGSRLSIVL